MKITPVSNYATPSAPSEAVNIKEIKMNTLKTPGEEGQEGAPKLSISDNNEATPTLEATEPLSPQMAALAKQRRVLQQERRAFLDEKKAFEEAKSQGSDAVTRADLLKDPLRHLLDAGVTYEQLTEAILNNQVDPKYSALEQELSSLKEDVEKKFTEREEQGIQHALGVKKREAEKLIFSSDEYELVRETKSLPDVIKLIERTYRETGEELQTAEALKLIEDELFERSQKLVSAKKLQNLFIPQAQQRPQGMRTLTNKDTASIPMSARARALAAFNGTLKR